MVRNDLMTEYRQALKSWREAMALYGPDGPELIEAALRLEAAETALRQQPVAA